MLERIIFLAAAFLMTCCAYAADIEGVNNLNQSEPNIYTGGQPESFTEVANAGVKHVVNLRPHSETPEIDEQALVTENGMAYHHLPIQSAQDLNQENVQALDNILKQAGGDTVLVHCASSNRVGALAALRASWLQNKSDEQALNVGKAWGLTGMQPAVEQLLKQH